MLKTIVRALVSQLKTPDPRQDELLKMTKVEYRHDWEYAYTMLSAGKQPYSD